MAATIGTSLGDLKTQLEFKLGETSIQFFTAEVQRQALNNAVKDLWLNYDWVFQTPTTVLTFTSGEVSPPTDYHHYIKMFDDNNTVWTKVSANVFDGASGNVWTLKLDDSDTLKIFVNPTTTTTLNFRYESELTEMEDDGDLSGIPSKYDEAIVYGALVRLAERERDVQWIQKWEQKYEFYVNQAVQDDRRDAVGHESAQLNSAFQHKSLLNRN